MAAPAAFAQSTAATIRGQVLVDSAPAANAQVTATNLATGVGDAWLDRSQPPVGAYIAWLIHQRLRDETLLHAAYPVLAANHAWWLKTRDGNGDGLYEYGSSEVGSGLYIGTKLAAKDKELAAQTETWKRDRSTGSAEGASAPLTRWVPRNRPSVATR